MMRSKKRKPKLNTFMLHSKSTYFYKQWLDSLKSCSDNLANDFRWASSHREQNVGDVRMRTHTNRTQPSREKKSYSKIAHYSSSYILPVVCITALLLVLGIMINPFLPGGGGEGVYAAESSTSSGSSGMSVALTMNDPDETTLVNNAKTGGVNYISTGFKVKTENVDGYNVYVQTAPGSTNKLTNGILSIDFVTTETPTSSFTDNTWGYAVDDTGASAANLKYSPVPDTAASALNPAYTSDKSNDERNFTLNFAAKFAADATPGHYTSGVLLSVAAGAEEVTFGIGGITTMQEMSYTVCRSRINIGESGRLKDVRDGKLYWITKLKDGNCWMTQNLALDIPASGLGKNDTDIPEDWNSNSTYKPVATQVTATPGGFTGNNVIASWNPAMGGAPTYCNDGGVAGKCKQSNNSTTSINDGHDAQGNYYTWGAATAGAGNDTVTDFGINMSQSICPKGWKLPTGESGGEIQSMFNGLLSEDIIASPYYFISGGWVKDNSLQYAGERGYYWSSTSGAVDNLALVMFFTNSTSATNGSRSTGNSVRCVAR